MSITIRNMFASPVATTFLDLDNDALEKYCREKCSTSKKFQNRGYTQSDSLDLTSPELKKLLDCVHRTLNSVHIDLGLSPNYQPVVFNAWANVDNNWSIRVPHSHPESAFACVYYINGNEESGALEFINPNLAQPRTIFPEHIAVRNEFTGGNFHIQPSPGRLVIFPAWLYHYVNSGTGNDERISIALIVKFVKKEIE
jgi:uncharacterized protein (TIGR02466 family)